MAKETLASLNDVDPHEQSPLTLLTHDMHITERLFHLQRLQSCANGRDCSQGTSRDDKKREREKEEMELKRNNSMTDFQSRNSNEFTGKLELHKRIKQVLHPIRKRREKTKVCLKDKTELFQKGILNCHLTICM